MIAASDIPDASPMLLKNLRLAKFQTVFSVDKVSGGDGQGIMFVFDAQDQSQDMKFVEIWTNASHPAPQGFGLINETRTNANMPAVGPGDTLWVRVTCDGSDVKVRCLEQSGEPSSGDWSGQSDCYSSTGNAIRGGRLGFWAHPAGYNHVDDVTIKSWNTGNSSYDITEMKETFTAFGGATQYTEELPTYDKNGNLSYDGNQKYTYDAWNRLMTVAHAYYDGSVHSGQVSATMGYDGANRRISKIVSNSGDWDCTYHYYYEGWRLAEVRNGSDVALKQYVWGRDYTDELVQIRVNGDPSDDDTCEQVYYAIQDNNYNVIGITDDSGVLIERYEYDAYGVRRVYRSAGSNDPHLLTPAIYSQRAEDGGNVQAYGLCDIGHQGLFHDEETGLIQNRYRYIHPTLGRFLNRDPIGYGGGTANLYEYELSSPTGWVDPSGLVLDTIWDIGNVIYDGGRLVKNGGEVLYEGGRSLYFWGVGNEAGLRHSLDELANDAGELGEAAIDTAADGGATLVPFVPAGGTKLARKLAKGADEAADIAKAADKARDVRKAADNCPDAKVPDAPSGKGSGENKEIVSRYPDDTPVYKGEKPNRLPREPNNAAKPIPDPDAGDAAHTRLRIDETNNRIYQGREFDANGNPVKDTDITVPTYPNGTRRPDHEHYENHDWEFNPVEKRWIRK